MIDQIIRWSLHNRLLVLATSLGLLLWGGWAALKTPIDVFPDLTAPSVTIVAEAHGMPPEDVEALVTIPIESAMNGAVGVRRVRSNTGVGNSVVIVEFEWGTDIYLARQIVSEKLQGAMSSLPPDLPPPQLACQTRLSKAMTSPGLDSATKAGTSLTSRPVSSTTPLLVSLRRMFSRMFV